MKLPSTLVLAACTLIGSSFAVSEVSAQSRANHTMTITTSRGRLGAQVIGISEHLRRYFAAPADAGLLVDHVLPNSPAAQADLRTGDVIIKVGDTPIREVWDIFQALGASKKGDKANIKIIRNKKPKTLQVTLDSDAPSPSKGWGDASNPFEGMREWNFGKHFRDDRDFPFGPMLENAPRELQDKIRKLEERLERLEGDNGKSKPTKPPKRLKGAQGTQKSS